MQTASISSRILSYALTGRNQSHGTWPTGDIWKERENERGSHIGR